MGDQTRLPGWQLLAASTSQGGTDGVLRVIQSSPGVSREAREEGGPGLAELGRGSTWVIRTLQELAEHPCCNRLNPWQRQADPCLRLVQIRSPGPRNWPEPRWSANGSRHPSSCHGCFEAALGKTWVAAGVAELARLGSAGSGCLHHAPPLPASASRRGRHLPAQLSDDDRDGARDGRIRAVRGGPSSVSGFLQGAVGAHHHDARDRRHHVHRRGGPGLR